MQMSAPFVHLQRNFISMKISVLKNYTYARTIIDHRFINKIQELVY